MNRESVEFPPAKAPQPKPSAPKKPRRAGWWAYLRVILPIVILLAGAAAGGAAAFVRDTRLFEGRIYPGVSIAGTSVAGLSPAEAAAVAQRAADAVLTKRLALQIGQDVVSFSYADLGVQAFPDEVVAAAYAQVRTGTLVDRVIRRLELLSRPLDQPVRFSRNDPAVTAVLTKMAAGFSATPQDATVTVQGGRVVITRESQEGRALNVAVTAQRMVAALDAGGDNAVADVEIVAPKFTTAQAQEIRAPLATYATNVGGVANRVHNVGLAAGYIRGTLLAPGAVFSYNKTVGPRTGARGFREAPVLVDNELVPGDGGGVCQVSSTLFNVALLADLQILARTNHMRPVAYLPIGRDATVTYGGLDLQFKNTTGRYVLIWASLLGRRLTFSAYGAPDPAKEVAIYVTERSVIPAPSYTVTKKDPLLDEGKTVIREALPGYRARTYRIVKVGGEVVKRELVASSYYNPVARTIKIGAKKPPAQPSSMR
ncbi:MAG TPA: VanW family protein [bacterium]|nr:VanW family protein [bacterium]